jgi:protein JBTS26
VFLDFGCVVTLSLIRIWNFNKSRPHAARGARFVTLHLDDRLIFRGEISKAPGTLAGAEACAENILFTTDVGGGEFVF